MNLDKLKEEILGDLQTLTGDGYQTDYYPVSVDWLSETITRYAQAVREDERERTRLLCCPCGCDMLMDEKGYAEAHGVNDTDQTLTPHNV